MQLKPSYAHSSKGNRLQIRIDQETYYVLEKAAQYKKGSLSRFVREASLKEAKKIIREHENMPLSDQDWPLLMEALSAPPKPNEALQKAYAKYKKDSE
ncbi:MAG: hypothetical protein ACD_16C00082G0003 [uncultured bacterium]|nr:MAG: hypothetical protein ACD_16C00082G0003 [uncultured bacterium]OFW69390.1 MAG: hypothetical protein A2X70_00360 [Alphaproteobacteria bacterium GWC2_42_16]OFW74149.1 MAG: hypothetical protein A2Z80_01410 [Alphaproteobacteria bacterium GWA2_41_27]OFW84144.1 MAG: hypothetical protein A3E50_00540 [Alphaproteobacteria bacterium RIFCSPHIGHO2_12_FULL_42_100]OFW84763.1 MAG: hypothetical protein A2W06_01555 [Alphaproteobacteria bacterium RBG_16_42_14]OFW90891.1 MAG: hypothetical protein A2W46_070